MPTYVVERVFEVLSERGIRSAHPKILVVGIAYKKDVKDLRKSPALDIIEILRKKNIPVSYYDPLIPFLKFSTIDLKCIRFKASTLSKFDCAIICTDHSSVDYGFLRRCSRIIFDSRNVYRGREAENIVRL